MLRSLIVFACLSAVCLLGCTRAPTNQDPVKGTYKDISKVAQKDLPERTLTSPDQSDLVVIKVCEGIVHLFQDSPDAVWPGFDLSSRPFVVYRADKWALLLGHRGEAPGFDAYPSTWPRLGFPIRFHAGTYANLSGQLEFGFPVGDKQGVAIGVPNDFMTVLATKDIPVEASLLGYIVHESFHQYQDEKFGKMDSPSEERYPILDLENSALAALEMHVLLGTLAEAERADLLSCEESARQFVAVRSRRWEGADEFVRKFEPGLELREGTAEYVGLRAAATVGALRYEPRVLAGKSLRELLSGMSLSRLLRNDFEERLSDGVVAPDDMPRNRVYPVGTAQCVLLDTLGVDWRAESQRAAADFSYTMLLRRRLALDSKNLDRYLAKAKERYDYDRLRTAAAEQVAKYKSGFKEALRTFESQPGVRIEVGLSTNGLGRSRTSVGRKWLLDGGSQSLCALYQAYVLKRANVRLELRDTGVLELNDWKAKRRTAIGYASGEPEIVINGQAQSLKSGKIYTFKQIRISAQNLNLDCSQMGTAQRSGVCLRLDLD